MAAEALSFIDSQAVPHAERVKVCIKADEANRKRMLDFLKKNAEKGNIMID